MAPPFAPGLVAPFPTATVLDANVQLFTLTVPLRLKKGAAVAAACLATAAPAVAAYRCVAIERAIHQGHLARAARPERHIENGAAHAGAPAAAATGTGGAAVAGAGAAATAAAIRAVAATAAEAAVAAVTVLDGDVVAGAAAAAETATATASVVGVDSGGGTAAPDTTAAPAAAGAGAGAAIAERTAVAAAASAAAVAAAATISESTAGAAGATETPNTTTVARRGSTVAPRITAAKATAPAAAPKSSGTTQSSVNSYRKCGAKTTSIPESSGATQAAASAVGTKAAVAAQGLVRRQGHAREIEYPLVEDRAAKPGAAASTRKAIPAFGEATDERQVLQGQATGGQAIEAAGDIEEAKRRAAGAL